MLVQVSLVPSALGGDGSGVAATVTVPGGNKVKMKDGEALFKNVRIEADAPGAYTLHVKSASRKVLYQKCTVSCTRSIMHYEQLMPARPCS